MLLIFKNHFIAGLCTANTHFPLQIWDRLLVQATITLNLIHKSRINPNISAHKQLCGIFNFNLTLFAPPRTIILVHGNSENRATYAPDGSYGWYIGRAPLHYRLFKLYITSTKSERTSDTVDFFFHHFYMPKTSSSDSTAIVASQIIHDL